MIPIVDFWPGTLLGVHIHSPNMVPPERFTMVPSSLGAESYRPPWWPHTLLPQTLPAPPYDVS